MADAPAIAPAENRPPRRRYLDWVRGLAVVIMIEAHLLDSWTAEAYRHTTPFSWALILGGFGAPLFLLLAGVSVSLSAASKARRSNDVTAASRAVMRRGLEIFGLAFVFRVQAWILGLASPWSLLRVDILNIMGPSIIAAAALWGAASTRRGRLLVFAAATVAMALLTPLVRASHALAVLPDPIEAYLRPIAGLTNFTLLPWAGFTFAGALLGVWLEPARSSSAEQRTNLAFGIGGALLAIAAYRASFLPPLFWRSEFWTSSLSFFFLRLGVLVATIAVGYLWMSRPGGPRRWSPIELLGRSSLFIYWIHVEMVYGLISLPIHHALTLPQSLIALVLFTALMVAAVLAKDRVVARAWWPGSRSRGL